MPGDCASSTLTNFIFQKEKLPHKQIFDLFVTAACIGKSSCLHEHLTDQLHEET